MFRFFEKICKGLIPIFEKKRICPWDARIIGLENSIETVD